MTQVDEAIIYFVHGFVPAVEGGPHKLCENEYVELANGWAIVWRRDVSVPASPSDTGKLVADMAYPAHVIAEIHRPVDLDRPLLPARMPGMSGVTEKLRGEIGYDEMEDSPIDTLIAYKDALEELVDRIDEAMRANAGKADYSMSAADITGMLYGMGFGE